MNLLGVLSTSRRAGLRSAAVIWSCGDGKPGRLPVGFECGFPVFVKGFESGLEIPVPVLGADGLDGVAPGCGLAEQVFQLGDHLFDLADLAFDLSGLAVREFSPGLLFSSGCFRITLGCGGRLGPWRSAGLNRVLFRAKSCAGRCHNRLRSRGLLRQTRDQPVDDLVEKIAVMADHEDGAFEFVDRSLERFSRPDIEVVGGLVHDEEIGRCGAEAGECGLGLFTAGKLADGMKRDVAFQPEAGEQVADVVLDPIRIIFRPDGADDRGAGVERSQALIVIADLHLVPELGFAGIGFLVPDQGLDQRGFACAVGPDDADAFAPADGEAQVAEEGNVEAFESLRASMTISPERSTSSKPMTGPTTSRRVSTRDRSSRSSLRSRSCACLARWPAPYLRM